MKYQFITADPPWSFKTYSDKGKDKGPEKHYSTMTLEHIAALDVKSVAAKDCILGLWTTWPLLPEAIEVGRSWGFTYKTVLFVWVKQTVNGELQWGNGYYTRANSEPCLLFTIGNPGKYVKDKGVHQVIETSDAPTLPGFDDVLYAQAGRHSAKPDAFYNRVDRLLDPSVNKIEVFGRCRRAGWSVLGNEINGMDINIALHWTSQIRRNHVQINRERELVRISAGRPD